MFNVIIKKGNQVIQKVIDAKKVIFALGNPIYFQENLGVTQVYAYDILSSQNVFYWDKTHGFSGSLASKVRRYTESI